MKKTLTQIGRQHFGVPNKDGYLPIPLDTIRIDSIPNFNLFNKAAGTYILYRSGNHLFTEKQQQSLLDHNVTALYVPSQEFQKYWDYIEDNVFFILSDPLLPVSKKAKVFQATSIELSKKIISPKATKTKIRRALDIVKNSSRVMFEGREGFHAFLEIVASNSDLYTHSVNVCSYGLGLAHALGISEERIYKLGIGLILHDLGIMDIKEDILNKSGPLTTKEWQLVRAHPALGAKLYRECGGNDDEIEMIIMTHHERLDGNGYPKGLTGEKIPLLSRIASIVNIFDALTTSRPFRPALSTFGAITTMKVELSRAIDQQIMNIFIRLLGPGS